MFKKPNLTVIVIFAGIFMFLRIYKINDSLLFSNDMGRDMKVMQQWYETGKPPLLGPQTSVMPFNQSAVYFYLLFPGFLLSGGNPISSVYTLTVLYLCFLLASYYFLHKDKKLFTIVLIAFLLLSIHPQYIIQGRFVWNPSFVTPLIITAVISFYKLLESFAIKKLIAFSVSIALAVSMSYSVTPLLIAFMVLWIIASRQYFFKYFIALFISFFIINSPTVLFELRHKFLLTLSLFSKNTTHTENISLYSRYLELSRLTFPTDSQNLSLFLSIFTLLSCLFLTIKHFKNRTSLSYIVATLYLLNTIITFMTPFPIHSHYIFGFTSLFFILVGVIPKICSILIITIFSIYYLQPTRIEGYFKPAPRTYQEMSDCYLAYCNTLKEQTFVSLQSGLVPFHNGPEHRYLLKKEGCNVKDIEKESDVAKYMTVIVESSTFDTKVTYYELDLFGKHQEISRHNCQSNLQVVTLKKI